MKDRKNFTPHIVACDPSEEIDRVVHDIIEDELNRKTGRKLVAGTDCFFCRFELDSDGWCGC